MEYTHTFPMPPSLNQLWRNFGGHRVIKSKVYRDWELVDGYPMPGSACLKPAHGRNAHRTVHHAITVIRAFRTRIRKLQEDNTRPSREVRALEAGIQVVK